MSWRVDLVAGGFAPVSIAEYRQLARIAVEARAYRIADATIRDLRYGRVLGLLDAGATIRDLRYGRVLGLLDAGGDTWALVAA